MGLLDWETCVSAAADQVFSLRPVRLWSWAVNKHGAPSGCWERPRAGRGGAGGGAGAGAGLRRLGCFLG